MINFELDPETVLSVLTDAVISGACLVVVLLLISFVAQSRAKKGS